MRNDAISILSRKLGVSKEAFHQNYETIGRAMIIREEDSFDEYHVRFGRLMRSSFKLWSVYKYTGIENAKRIPAIELISGIHTDVVQREDGVLYAMDPAKVMFSKGNKRERHYLRQIVRHEETVLDMFAGIGYFSIPLSFDVKRIYSCDINPDSFHYLLMNVRLNRVRNLVPMLGDSSRIPLRGFADRIIMGHFESSRYLKSALGYLKDEGDIHLHQLVKRGETGKVREKFGSYDYVDALEIRRVKSYSPSLDHVVLDLHVKKN